MPPSLILLVGMATILGAILLLRLNAFLALIIAAIVVSLLAPGSTGNFGIFALSRNAMRSETVGSWRTA